MIGPVGLRGLALDIGPLREHRDFRLILAGMLVSDLGMRMTQVALPYQVYVLTESPLALGALAAMQLAGVLLLSLAGGAIADSMDRRTLLFITQAGMCTAAVLLTALALAGSTAVWPLFLLAFMTTVFQCVDRPARQSIIPRLVSRENVSAAIALNQMGLQAGHMVGPTIGGLLIASVGVVAAFGVNAVTFGAALLALGLIAPLPPLEATAGRPGWRSVVEGVQYIRKAKVLLGMFALDFDAMVFGLPTALYPILALTVFDAGPTGLGLLMAAPAVGGVLGLLSSGWVHRVRRQGRVVMGAVGLWSVAIMAFGFTTFLPLALVFLCIAGAANSMGTVARWTVIQLYAPDRLRGRVAALNGMVVSSGPRLGDIEATTVAAFTSAQFSVVTGGLLSLVGLVWIARAFPQLASFDALAHVKEVEASEPPGEMVPASPLALAAGEALPRPLGERGR